MITRYTTTLATATGVRTILLLAIFAFLSNGVKAQSSSVYDQLVRISETMIEQGYSKSHDFEVDDLNEDESDRYTVTLQKGTTYKIIAVCDNDCQDIDLCLFDENGNEIDCDTTEDDVPVVEATPKWTGEFTIKVTMYHCGVEPCYFGIGVYRER